MAIQQERLENPYKEKFCRHYAGAYWGDPCGAVRAAGYTCSVPEAVSLAESLFDDPEVRKRIVSLRRKRMDELVADETWIRELLADIAVHAEKDSDRIRALNSLAKAVALNPRKKSPVSEDDSEKILPFEGLWEGYSAEI